MRGYFETPNTIHFKIDKPIYATFVGLRDIYIERAKRLHKRLVIETNGIRGICTAEEWEKTAKRFDDYKLNPNIPMKMLGNHVSRFVKKPKENLSILTNPEIMLKIWEKKKNEII